MLTVSDTAYAIAFIRAEEARLAESERLFDDPYARIFDAAGDHAREGTERFVALPFFTDGIRLRTRHIDDLVRDAISHGIGQFVLMGAGFDSRALRLSEVAEHDIQTFEIDLPAPQEAKRGLLERSGVAIPASLHHIACDFASDFETRLAEDLAAQGFARSEPAVFVWEGVIPYLAPEAVDKTVRFMASIGAPGSRLIFDFSEFVHGPEWARELVQRAGFTGFSEVDFEELWRRHHLPGDPYAHARSMKIGIASK